MCILFAFVITKYFDLFNDMLLNYTNSLFKAVVLFTQFILLFSYIQMNTKRILNKVVFLLAIITVG